MENNLFVEYSQKCKQMIPEHLLEESMGSTWDLQFLEGLLANETKRTIPEYIFC